MLQDLLLLAVGGVFAGLLAGLLGVGGGIILVPLLIWILPYFGIPSAQAMHAAVATSMAVISVTSFSSARVHWQRGQIAWMVFRGITLGSVVGTLIGINIAYLLPGRILHIVFGVITLVIAIRIILNLQPKIKHPLPNKYVLSIWGLVLGIICALLGMGGGALLVPYLNRYQLDMRNIVATSAVCTIPIALMGTLGFLLLSIGQIQLSHVKWATGYIYWPAFFAISIASVIFAPVGAKLAHRIPAAILRQIFGIFLVAVSTHMLTLGIFAHATLSKV